jgi:hypothetical protein
LRDLGYDGGTAPEFSPSTTEGEAFARTKAVFPLD